MKGKKSTIGWQVMALAISLTPPGVWCPDLASAPRCRTWSPRTARSSSLHLLINRDAWDGFHLADEVIPLSLPWGGLGGDDEEEEEAAEERKSRMRKTDELSRLRVWLVQTHNSEGRTGQADLQPLPQAQMSVKPSKNHGNASAEASSCVHVYMYSIIVALLTINH